MTSSTCTLILDNDGGVRYLSDEELPALTNGIGKIVRHYRNSHVDTWRDLRQTTQKWLSAYYAGSSLDPSTVVGFWVDLLELGECVMGPFEYRLDAVEAEKMWCLFHDIPLIQPN